MKIVGIRECSPRMKTIFAIISAAMRYNYFTSYLPISMQVHWMTHTMHPNKYKAICSGKYDSYSLEQIVVSMVIIISLYGSTYS